MDLGKEMIDDDDDDDDDDNNNNNKPPNIRMSHSGKE
jgi:hypothetical protein